MAEEPERTAAERKPASPDDALGAAVEAGRSVSEGLAARLGFDSAAAIPLELLEQIAGAKPGTMVEGGDGERVEVTKLLKKRAALAKAFRSAER